MMRLVVLVAAALLLAPAAFASEQHPTLNELENEVMCPVCGTTLAQSDSAAAKQIERQIQIRIKAGWTKSRIKDMLVQQYGESILAAPPKHGFNLLAWLLPLVALGAAAGLVGHAVSLNSTRVQAVAGFVVVVFGLAFVGLLPFPERLVAPGLVGGARRRGSGALLGAAFAVCAAPCMGPVLGTILVLAGSTTTVARGSVL